MFFAVCCLFLLRFRVSGLGLRWVKVGVRGADQLGFWV